MRAAFELHDLAVAMRREVLKREHPGETAEQIEARLRSWLLESGTQRRPAIGVGAEATRESPE